MFDFSNVCRLCTLSDNLKYNLKSAGTDNVTVEDKLRWLEPSTLEDNLPNLICEICNEKLNQAFAFKVQCLYAVEKLIHSLETSDDQQVDEIKEEILDIPEESYSDTKSDTKSDIDIKDDEDFNYCETEIVEDTNSLLTKVSQTNNNNKISKGPNKLGAIRSADNRFEYTIQNDSEKIVYISNFRKKIFNCNNCQKCFSGATALKRHLLVHLKHRAYKCDICGIETYTKAALKSHQVVHQEEGGVVCDICGKTFKSKERLRAHSNTHSKNYICDLCGKKFANTSLLKKHQICKHSDKRDFKCSICEFAAKTPAYLKRHMTRHDPEKKYQCPICPLLLKSSTSLKNHVRIHKQDTKYTCHVCSKRFVLKSHYDIHFRIHSNDKPYLCTYCGKRFRRQDHHKNHVRIHTKEKPFECDLCNKSFAQKISLVVHQRTHTNGKQKLQCEHCDKTFYQLNVYKRHLPFCKSE